MNEKRSKPGVGVVDDKIFVIGGFDDEQCLKTIEVYSEKRKRWEMMKMTMKTGRRSDMGVAVIGDFIFIFLSSLVVSMEVMLLLKKLK